MISVPKVELEAVGDVVSVAFPGLAAGRIAAPDRIAGSICTHQVRVTVSNFRRPRIQQQRLGAANGALDQGVGVKTS